MLQFIISIIVLLPIIFTQPERIEATNILVYEDGSFTLNAENILYGGCLPNGACTDGGTQPDNVTIFEDGSAVWYFNNSTEIAGCFFPQWGCN